MTTAISAANSVPSSRGATITAEVKQSTLVGAVAGTAIGIGGGRSLPWAMIGLVTGSAAGLGAGLARGAVDSVTGTGPGEAVLQTLAGATGAVAGGIGGIALTAVTPGLKKTATGAAGMNLFFVASLAAIGATAATVVPPILDQFGRD